MSRIRLKNGGKPRYKAFLGADGAVMAAATLAAAATTAAATASAAKEQAKSVTDSAKIQADSIKQQTNNNNNLQKEQIAFTRSQNQENRELQQDIQTTLQLIAGQQNMNDRMAANKIQVKYGGRPKHKLSSIPFYGGDNPHFQVTDGGGVIPISIDDTGYGLYELYGNDHEHYHKTKNGKSKSGVGIKFNDGSVVEGEGNQNTNQGELLYITPQDAMFISKHSIDGFNPTKAVMEGLHPEQAFAIQETLKDENGLNDDGSKMKRRTLKRMLGGTNINFDQANMTQNINNNTAPIATGIIYGINNNKTSSPVEEYVNPIIHTRRHNSLKYGGRPKAFLGINKNDWEKYAGATYNAAGNLIGAGLSAWGNMYAGRKLGKAYSEAGNILADAYSQMHGIDLSEINREDYEAPHTLAVVRTANTNINPQLQRIRRDAAAERREINRGTMSSAARLQRLAAANDRAFQRMGEQYAYKDNADETIRQGNAERITQTAQANADRDVQANREWGNQRLSILQYNNNIDNAKLAGMGQARADALTQSSMANATAFQNTMTGIGNAIGATGQGFASAFDANQAYDKTLDMILAGADTEHRVNYAIDQIRKGNSALANEYYNEFKNSDNKTEMNYARRLAIALGLKQ